MASFESSLPRTADRRGTPQLREKYFRVLRASRLMKAAFWTTMGFFLFWAIPWLPGGLSEDDYNRHMALTLIFSSSGIGMGVMALVLREWLRRLEEALGAYNALYDNTTGLYNRRYFLDRLTLECDRSSRHGRPFAVLLFRFEAGDAASGEVPDALLRAAAEELARVSRSSDVVAIMGGNELAVAAIGADEEVARDLGWRFRSAIEGVLSQRGGQHPVQWVRLGVSTYPGDGTNAAALVRLAHESMLSGEARGAPGAAHPDERRAA